MDKDTIYLMSWISIIVLVVIGVFIANWIIPKQPYVIDIKYCNSDNIDLEVIKIICIDHCTEKLSYEDGLLQECYKACNQIH